MEFLQISGESLEKKKWSVGCDEWVNNGKNWSFGTNISGACSELIGNKQAWDDTYIYDDWEFPHPTQYVVPYTCRIKVKTLFINLFKGVLPSGWPNGPNIHLKVFREFVSTRYSSELCWRHPPPLPPPHSKAREAKSLSRGDGRFWAIMITVMKYKRSADSNNDTERLGAVCCLSGSWP